MVFVKQARETIKEVCVAPIFSSTAVFAELLTKPGETAIIGKGIGVTNVCVLNWKDPNTNSVQKTEQSWERRIILTAAFLCRLAIGN